MSTCVARMAYGVLTLSIVLSSVTLPGWAHPFPHHPFPHHPPPADPDWQQLERDFIAGTGTARTEYLEHGKAAIPHLARIINNKNANSAQFQAATVLGEIGAPECVPPLLDALDHSWFNVRRCAAWALGKLRDESARDKLERVAAEDPYTWTDSKSGEKRYLVREAAQEALDSWITRIPDLLADPRQPPTSSQLKRPTLSWPFDGDFVAQKIYNNYQQPTDIYVHAGLDFLQTAGTEVRAVDSGTVRCIATHYPQSNTHHFFVVEKEPESGEGWCYTHVDPASYTFEVGTRIEKGQVLGKIVPFSVGGRPGIDHLHLHYVSFERLDDGKVETRSLYDPLARFPWKDDVMPLVQQPLICPRGTTRPLPTENAVSGQLDILVGIGDQAHAGHIANWMTPVVTLEIRGRRTEPWGVLVLDQRGEVSTRGEVSALYVPSRQRSTLASLQGVPANPVTYYLIATHSDGDGVIESSDAHYCWDTTLRNAEGQPRFPNGEYEITIRAWDLAGNLGVAQRRVRVENKE